MNWIEWDSPPITKKQVSIIEGIESRIEGDTLILDTTNDFGYGWDEDLELNILREQNQKLLEVVRFYANKENWTSSYSDEHLGNDEYFDLLVGTIDIDNEKYAGKQAREVLKELGIVSDKKEETNE